MRRKVAGALALVAAGLAVSSCGGSTSGQPTRPEFVRRADAVCTRQRQETAAVYRSLIAKRHQGRSLTQLKNELKTRLPATRTREMAALSRIDAPGQLSDRYGQWLAALRTSNTIVVPANESVTAHTRRKAMVLRRQRLAAELGFKSCR
jgi:hypothetical protein